MIWVNTVTPNQLHTAAHMFAQGGACRFQLGILRVRQLNSNLGPLQISLTKVKDVIFPFVSVKVEAAGSGDPG